VAGEEFILKTQQVYDLAELSNGRDNMVWCGLNTVRTRRLSLSSHGACKPRQLTEYNYKDGFLIKMPN
jgi:hypothetical protein